MKKIILGLSVLIILSVAQSYAPKQDKRFTLSLTGQEVETVLKALGKLPLEESQNVYMTVYQQAQAQLVPPKPAVQKQDSTKKKQ